MHSVAKVRTSYKKQHDAFRDMKHMQKRLRNDELRVLRGEVEVDEAQLDNGVADLDTSASEDDMEPVRQAPAEFVPEKRSMHATNKGTEGGTVCSCLLPACTHWPEHQHKGCSTDLALSCLCAGGTVTGTLTGLLSEEDTSDDSIIDDTGSDSTRISKGITDDGDLFQDNDIGASLSGGSIKNADTESEASDF